jgi:hypothetical protein
MSCEGRFGYYARKRITIPCNKYVSLKRICTANSSIYMMAGNSNTTIPRDTAAWLNLSFTGKNRDLDQLSQQIEQNLKTDGYKTQSTKAPIGNVIQAQKAGVLRGIIDANRAFSILVAGQPNEFSVHIGIGKWIQNLGVAVVESLIFSPLALVVDGAEILWTSHVESGLAKQITQIVG